MLSDRQLLDEILDAVCFYTTSDRNPDAGIRQETAGGNNYYGDEPYSHRINCVQGQAARAIAALMYNDNTQIAAVRSALDALSRDPITSVRPCAIDAFMLLLNFRATKQSPCL